MTTGAKKERRRSAWVLENAAYGRIAKLKHEIVKVQESYKAAHTKYEERLTLLRADLSAAEAALGALKVPESAPATAKPGARP